LAKWCKADYIQHRVDRIIADQNRILLADGN
jgi:hypothetical protein